MRKRKALTVFSLVMMLGTAAIAESVSPFSFSQGVPNTTDPNLAMVPDGAPTSDLVWCDSCGRMVHANQALLGNFTRANLSRSYESNPNGDPKRGNQ